MKFRLTQIVGHLRDNITPGLKNSCSGVFVT